MIVLGISGCSSLGKPEVVEKVVVKTEIVERPKPIVPNVEPLNLRTVNWIIITEENQKEVFEKIKSSGKQPVLFGLTDDGFKNIALNNVDVNEIIQKYKAVISLYEK